MMAAAVLLLLLTFFSRPHPVPSSGRADTSCRHGAARERSAAAMSKGSAVLWACSDETGPRNEARPPLPTTGRSAAAATIMEVIMNVSFLPHSPATTTLPSTSAHATPPHQENRGGEHGTIEGLDTLSFAAGLSIQRPPFPSFHISTASTAGQPICPLRQSPQSSQQPRTQLSITNPAPGTSTELVRSTGDPRITHGPLQYLPQLDLSMAAIHTDHHQNSTGDISDLDPNTQIEATTKHRAKIPIQNIWGL